MTTFSYPRTQINWLTWSKAKGSVSRSCLLNRKGESLQRNVSKLLHKLYCFMPILPSNYQLFMYIIGRMLTLESPKAPRIGGRFHRLLLLVHTTNAATRTTVPFIRVLEIRPTTATCTNLCECVLHIKLIFQCPCRCLLELILLEIWKRFRWIVLRPRGLQKRRILRSLSWPR